ncbi:MAG: peptidylprolyl isomerase [Bacteroidota bacterium]|nr:MAG: peptidylprolyl isomerase [Bacteroidota bacterium]
MKKLQLCFLASFITLIVSAQPKYPTVIMETTAGTIKLILYEDTPLHSDNFVKLVNEGYYNGQLFHRVIKNFMIQTGDDQSISAAPGKELGTGGKDYTIPAEFRDKYYHKKGALAAARQGDATNPKKASSGSQFYIVQGMVLDSLYLDAYVKKGMHKPFTEIEKADYSSIGGTPHLDTQYTVFGEVIEGLEVIDQIASVATDTRNRPLEDIKIIKMYTLK